MRFATPVNVVVAGGGNGAHVLVASCSSRFNVSVFASFQDEAARFRTAMGEGEVTLNYENKPFHSGRPGLVTNDASLCIPKADVVLVSAPAFAFESVLRDISPHVSDGTLVVSLPGQGGFQWLARHALRDKDVVIAGLNQLPYQCRIQEFGRSVELIGHKEEVQCAAFPPQHTATVCSVLSDLIGLCRVTAVESGAFVGITLTPSNQVIHPSIMYGLFKDWKPGVEYDEPPLFYQNTNDETAAIMDAISQEIVHIASALSREMKAPLHVPTIDVMMKSMYGSNIVDASSTKTIFSSNKGYAGLRAPMLKLDNGKFVPKFRYRYLTEDIPHGLCVIKGIAELAHVKDVPTINRMILWAQHHLGKKFLEPDGSLAPDFYAHTTAPQAHHIAEMLGGDSLDVNKIFSHT